MKVSHLHSNHSTSRRKLLSRQTRDGPCVRGPCSSNQPGKYSYARKHAEGHYLFR